MSDENETGPVEINTRQAAELIAAANRVAGLQDGYIKIRSGLDRINVCGASDVAAIDAALSEAIAACRENKSDPAAIDISTVVFDDPECESFLGTAVIVIDARFPDVLIGDEIATAEEDDEEDGERRPRRKRKILSEADGAAKLAQIDASADRLVEHLRRIGFSSSKKPEIRDYRAASRHCFSVEGVAFVSGLDHEAEGDDVDDLRHIKATRALVAQMPDMDRLYVSDERIFLGALAAVDLCGETADAYVGRLVLSLEYLEKLADVWEKNCGRKFDVFRRMVPSRSAPPRVEFLVPGLVPAGSLAVILGAHEVGKSTLMHELAIAAAATAAGADGWTWLGQPISKETARGGVAFLCGEDAEAVVHERLKTIDPKRESFGRLASWPMDPRPLREILDDVRAMAELSLIVVDPMRKYLEGSEDDSTNVNRFFSELEAIALEKGCAVVVSHHLSKNADPVNISGPGGVIAHARGSTAVIDRPRVVMGIMRRNDETTFRVGKSNLPPSCGVNREPIRLKRDPATLRHLPVDKVSSKESECRTSSSDAEAENAALAALTRLQAEGVSVARTGARGLYELQPPELAGISRARARGAVAALIAAGRLCVVEGCLTVANPGA